MAQSTSHAQLGQVDLLLFEKAKEQFLAQLSDEEKSKFSKYNSADEVLADLSKLQNFTKDKRKLTRAMASIELFSKQLEPFFDIFGIIVQSHPEWTAIAWGAFRLVLQLASNFVGFFERLGNMLSHVGSLLPAYKDVLNLLRGSHKVSDRLCMSLRNFYLDLLEFFGSVARVFTQKSGKLKKTPVVIGQLMWQPFDVRFANFIERLGSHERIFSMELDVMNLSFSVDGTQLQADLMSKLEMIRKEGETYASILNKLEMQMTATDELQSLNLTKAWINPPDFRNDYEQSLAQKQNGTAEWLFDEPKFKSWIHSASQSKDIGSPQNLLWIKGNPGCGKTTLAASTIQELQRSLGHASLCYFFFRHRVPGKCSKEDAFRAIMAQLLHQHRHDPLFLERVSFFKDVRNEGQMHASQDDIFKLFQPAAQRLQGVYIVIDGIDECDDPDDLLLQFQRAFHGTCVRALLFSRPNVNFLQTALVEPQSIAMTRTSVEADLELYFSEQVEKLQDLNLITPVAEKNILVEHLLSGADGMFLWGRLMMNYLRSPILSRQSRLSIILNVEHPEKLDEMYFRVCSLIETGVRRSKELARSVFVFLTYSASQLSAIEVYDATTNHSVLKEFNTSIKEFETSQQDLTDFYRSIIMVCGGLVEMNNENILVASEFRFIHHSVFEFFRMRGDSGKGSEPRRNIPGTNIFFCKIEAEAELALTSITYLLKRLPARPLSGDMLQRAAQPLLHMQFPFLRYAAQYWPQHLREMARIDVGCADEVKLISMSFENVAVLVSELIGAKVKIMVWIEALYTFASSPDWQLVLKSSLLQWADRILEVDRKFLDLSSEISALAAHLSELHSLWGAVLRDNPEQIWQDVTAFTPNRFFARTSATHVQHLKPARLSNTKSSSQPLTRISRVSETGDLLANLTIWPSSTFQEAWKSCSLRHDNSQLDLYCSDWLAQYELWDIRSNDSQILQKVEFDLEETEVRVQILRFLRYEKTRAAYSHTNQPFMKELVMSFPTSIGSRLNIFTVLRTVFSCDDTPVLGSVGEHQDPSHWRRRVVPVEKDIYDWFARKSHSDAADSTVYEASSASRTGRCAQSYRFTASHDNRYLLYQSVDRFDYITRQEDSDTTLSVYHLKTGEECDPVTLIGFIKPGAYSLTRCSFHPQYPLLLFGLREFETSIIVWCFSDLEESMREDETNQMSCRSRETDFHFNNWRSIVQTDFGSLEILQFSACGKQVIAKRSFQTHPHVVSIEDCTAYKIASESGRRAGCISNDTQQNLLVPTRDLRQVALSKNLSFGQGSILIHGPSGDNRCIRVSVESLGTNSSVQLISQRDSVVESQPILTLPAWKGVDSLSVKVLTPTAQNDQLSVILHHEPKLFYSMSDSAADFHPTVIRKDGRALPRMAIRDVEKSGRVHSRASGFTDSDEPPPKRLKISRSTIIDTEFDKEPGI